MGGRSIGTHIDADIEVAYAATMVIFFLITGAYSLSSSLISTKPFMLRPHALPHSTTGPYARRSLVARVSIFAVLFILGLLVVITFIFRIARFPDMSFP